MTRRTWAKQFLLVACALVASRSALATGVPIGGFLPLVGISLTDNFKNENHPTFLFADPEYSYSGNALGPGNNAHYDLALLDTGAAVNLVTAAAYASFNISSEGFSGTAPITLSGATGFVDAKIDDPLALFAVGLSPANIAGTAPLALHTTNMKGLSSTANVSLLPESDLPNIVGLPFATQHASYIRNDQPQIVPINGRTVRTPQIEFLPLGSGAQDSGTPSTMSRAPLILAPGAAFGTPPFYFPNFLNPELPFTENPSQPTIVSGGMFLNVNLQNTTPELGLSTLGSQFLFDTGADVTVMSEYNASLLGFDVILHKPEFTVAVVGSGGVLQDVPGFFADQLTLPAIGGNLVAHNVPIIVLDVPDVSNPVNVIPGIIGTNIFVGRNVVIDPITAIGGGSPSVYFGAPTTTPKNWTSASASGSFGTGGNWSESTAPDIRGVANVRHVSGGNQVVTVSANATVWELNVSGSVSQTMTLHFNPGTKLTTFSGINIESNGIVELQDATLDAQFVEVVGGTLRGTGLITTGSGPIPGQLENRSGTLAPGNGVGTLEIEGRFANGADGTLAIELGGLAAGTGHDQLVVDGAVALAGTLEVTLANSFTPTIGDEFTIIVANDGLSGEFEAFELPGGFNWLLDYSDGGVELMVGLPGDFDGDSMVDAADFTVWRDGLGSRYTMADYTSWKNNFGLGSGGVAGGNVTVPEPTAAAMMAIGTFIRALVRRRRMQQA